VRGGHVLPGFVDVHLHLSQAAFFPLGVDGLGWASLADALRAVRVQAGADAAAPWLLFWRVARWKWPEGRLPSAAELDEAAPGRRVLVSTLDMHRGAVSSAGLATLGITNGDSARFEGDVTRDRRGRPTEELRAETLWFPLHGAPSDWTEYLPELAGRFGLRIDYSGTTRGFANFLNQALARPTFFGMAMGPPPDPRVKVVPLAAPAPVFPWWVMWTRRVPTEFIDRLTATMTAGLADDLTFAADPRQAWLPDADRRHLLRDAAAHRNAGRTREAVPELPGIGRRSGVTGDRRHQPGDSG